MDTTTESKNTRYTGSKIAVVMKILFVLMLSFTIMFSLTACGSGDDIVDDYVENETDMSYDKDQEALDTDQLGNTILEITEDAGQEYLDNTLFIGDSNTKRTMLYGHTTWDNILAVESMGVQHITTLELAYFKGYDKPLTVPDAVKIIQPQRIIITYGTNNTIGWERDKFIETYKEGLNAIEKAYPYAEIIINSIPPIDKERENLAVTMQAIDKLNKALAEMAKAEGYKFLNSAEALKDEETGFAKKDYTIGDGVHLSMKGMEALFNYIKTHAYITDDTRPKPLKAIPEREETPTGIITQDPLAVRGTRIKIRFVSSDDNLGRVEGEVEQKIKRTITSQAVTADPRGSNGGIFTGWSCSYDGLSSKSDRTVTFTVPKVPDDVTEIVITANFAKTSLSINNTSLKLDKGATAQLSASPTGGFDGDSAVTWMSDNTAVATVDSNGLVTAVNGGQTKIVASILGGKIYTSCTVTVNQPLEGISLSGESNILTDKTTQLTLNLTPPGANADKNNATWKSSDENIATVSSTGVVTGKAEGSAVITAELNGFTATHTINVTQPKPLQGISLSGRTEVMEDRSVQLTVGFNPSNTTDSKAATWSSDNTAVATVADGTVIGVSAGTATITCKVGSFTATHTITVKQPPNTVQSVSISDSALSLTPGAAYTLSATVNLLDASREPDEDTTLIWSSDSPYVSVDASGNVRIAASGMESESGILSATITVSAGSKSATCSITITGVPVPTPESTEEPQSTSEQPPVEKEGVVNEVIPAQQVLEQ